MFEHIKLEYYYSVSAPETGGETTMTFKTGYDNSVKVKDYIINDDIKRGPIERFEVFSTGLVMFHRDTASLGETYSNMSFELHDDGIFYLVSD